MMMFNVRPLFPKQSSNWLHCPLRLVSHLMRKWSMDHRLGTASNPKRNDAKMTCVIIDIPIDRHRRKVLLYQVPLIPLSLSLTIDLHRVAFLPNRRPLIYCDDDPINVMHILKHSLFRTWWVLIPSVSPFSELTETSEETTGVRHRLQLSRSISIDVLMLCVICHSPTIDLLNVSLLTEVKNVHRTEIDRWIKIVSLHC